MSKKGFSFLLVLMTSTILFLASCGGGNEIVETGVADIVVGRWSHTATILNNGSVLIIGGESKFRTSVNSAELFGTDKMWTPAGNTLEIRGEGHTATLLDDGNVLVVGGSENAEIYNTSETTWMAAGSMEKPRVWHAVVKLEDGRILVAGGQNPSSRKAYRTAEIYDPSSNQWSRVEDMEETHTRDKMVLLADGKVLMAGKKLSEIFDPEKEIWTSAGRLMKQRDGSYAMTKLQDGRVLVTGGETLRGRASDAIPTRATGGVMASHDVNLVPTMRADIYDHSVGSWSAAAPMLEARKIAPAVLLEDGKVLVLGDQTTETYDPSQDKWTLKAPMLVARNYGHTATMLGDGSILVVGGNEGGNPFNPSGNKDMIGIGTVEIYDPNVVTN